MNEDFGLDDLDIAAPEPEKEVKAKPKAAAKKAAAKVKVEEEIIEAAPAPVKPEVFIDPERDRDNWPTIHIEMEDGKPNYEYLAAHGTLQNGSSFGHELQVMRGVDVQVPPSIVYALQDATATHFVQRRNTDGSMAMIRQNRSAIPWRLIKGGKYI